jgi:transcriptional regulator with XRE-family HTH domain
MYLPHSAKHALTKLGQQVRLARKRRHWTIAELAGKMEVSAPTIMALEKGQPTVGIGILFSALWVLGLDKALVELSALRDETGEQMLNERLPKKIRHKKQGLNNDF